MNRIESIMHKGFIAFAFLTLTFGGVHVVYSQASQNAVVDSFISRQAEKAGAEEYADARETLSGDVNGDGKADLIVLYSLEGFGGGNSYSQYLAIFLGKGKSFQSAANAVVGGKLNRNVDLKSVAAGKINLNTTEYRKNDAACCPSKKGKTRYVFSKGKLREIK